MFARSIAGMILLWSCATFAADLPGKWVEIENAPAHQGDLQDSPLSSGGRFFTFFDGDDFVGIPVTFDAPIAQPRLFVRYIRHDVGPALMKVTLVPEPAGDPKVAPVDLAIPGQQDGKNEWRWASFILPPIAAGKYTLKIGGRQPSPRLDVDLVGFVDRAALPRWMPPSVVKDGRFVGEAGIAPPVQIEWVAPRSHIRMVYGEEVLGEGAKPLVLEVPVTNLQREPVDLAVTVILSDAAGNSARTPGPRVTLSGDETRSIEVPIKPPSYGWFGIAIEAGDDRATSSAAAVIGVVHRPSPGLKPESMFGLNIGYSENDLIAAQMIGLKWRRGTPISFDPPNVAPAPGKWMDDKDAEPVRAAVRKWKDAGVSTLGLVNYNTTWNVAPGRDGKPADRWRNRPIDLNVQAEIEYRMFKALRGEITYWEIWNEPWVRGWTWQTGTAQDYREMSRLIWEKTKPDMPEIMLIGGGSTSYQRDVLFAPGNKDIGYVDGCSTHPYNSPDRTMPSSAAVEAELLRKYSRSKGVGGIWATEVGAPEYNFESEPESQRPFTVGKAIAPLYLLNKLGAGDMPIRVFYFTANWGGGGAFDLWDGPNPKPGLIAFSAMTHFLEDGKLQGDLFAGSTALWAPHFVKPDGSSVVAFWADDGFSGRMLLPAGLFEAYDYLGASTGTKQGDRLAIDFTRWATTYLVSRKSPEEVRAAIAAARFEGMDSLRINPRSFAGPVDTLPPLRVKVQNLLPQTVEGEVTLATPPEIELQQPTQKIAALKSGEIRFVDFALKKATPSAINRYRVDYTATVGGQTQKGTQVIQAAVATFGTPTIDGKLDDWAGVTPVTMLSRGGKDYLEAAMNPEKAGAILSANQPGGTVAYRLWTRWDESNLYLAAEVPDANLAFKSLAADVPDAFAFDGDCLLLGFDCLDPNPDDWFVGHPMHEKCLGSEIDYEFSAILARKNDASPTVGELHRLKAPGTNYQTLYDGNVELNPPLGAMNVAPAKQPAGQVAVSYDATTKVLRYEVAIPWTAIKELGEQVKALKPGQTHLTKFAFGVSDTGEGGRGKTFWTQEAGDLQSGAYGFSPTWSGGSVRLGGRILTDWGFTR